MKKIISYFLLALLFCVPVASAKFIMPVQGGGGGLSFTSVDFTSSFTEEDGQGFITSVTSSRVTWVDLTRQYNCWRIRDYGANYFDTDFTFRFIVNASNATASSYPQVHPFALCNDSGDTPDDWTGDGVNVRVSRNAGGSYYIRLYVVENGSASNDESTALSASTDYYVTVTRDDDAGANSTGQYKAYIRTGSHSGSLVDTLTLDASAGEQNNFQYLYAPVNNISGETIEIDGYVDSMEFVEEIE